MADKERRRRRKKNSEQFFRLCASNKQRCSHTSSGAFVLTKPVKPQEHPTHD